MTNSHKNKTIKGFLWNFINQFGNQGANFFFSIFLARLLGPEEYGLIAMVTVFSGFLGLLINFGFGSAAIQRDHVSENEWSTLFYCNLVFGVFSFFLLYAMAPAISDFFQKEILTDITRLIALGFIISPLSIVPQTKLVKKIDYKSISIVTLISTSLSGTAGIILALNNYGVYSLVWQRLLNYLFNLIGLWVANKFWIPNFSFSVSFIHKIFEFSFYTFLSGVLSFTTRNTDNLLIGKYIGDKSLGEYNRAYSFLMFPINMISRVIANVLFPSYSIIKDDLNKIASSFMSISVITSFITIPIMSIFFLCSKEIVLIVFGEQWISISYLLKLFCLMGVYQSILSLNGPLYISLGFAKLDFKIGFFTEITIIISLLIGVNWGLEGIIWSLYVATIINFIPSNYFILKKIGLSIGSYYSLFIKNIFFSIVLIITVNYINNYFHFINIYLLFFTKSILFMILYCSMHYFFKTKEFEAIIRHKPF